jgi:hypothetical protein
MSWQATAWAEKQKTGSPACKVLLLVLANYADERGYCWPSQEKLSKGTEQSVDTIQRNARRLEAGGFITIERKPRAGGRWPRLAYQLSMPMEASTEPQDAVRQQSNTVDKAVGTPAVCGSAEPHQSRSPGRTSPDHRAAQLCGTNLHLNLHENLHLERSAAANRGNAPAAAKIKRSSDQKRDGIEVVQDRIARRLGDGNAEQGWRTFMSLTESDQQFLIKIEQSGGFTKATLDDFRARALDLLPSHTDGKNNQ